jgi:hypothetical protein
MPAFKLAYYALPRWYEFGERRWNDIFTGENRRTRRKNLSRATLSTTNPTRIDSGVNPSLHGGRPATNDLSHGTVISIYIIRDVRWWSFSVKIVLDLRENINECSLRVITVAMIMLLRDFGTYSPIYTLVGNHLLRRDFLDLWDNIYYVCLPLYRFFRQSWIALEMEI